MRASDDWLLTIVQAALRIPRLWRHLDPTFHLTSVGEIDASFLQQEDIGGFIWDVDGTLMGCRHNDVAAPLQDAIASLFARGSTRHVVLSNCSESRFLELGRIFPTTPVLRGYMTPQGVAFRRLLGKEDTWEGGIPSGPLAALRPIRKPSTLLIEYALRELALSIDRVVMVGDQYLTDIAGANLAGIRSIKVPTLARESFSVPVRLLQLVDRGLYRSAVVWKEVSVGRASDRKATEGSGVS